MEQIKNSNRKLKLTIAGLIILSAVAIGLVLKDQFEPMLWGGWFVAFTGTLGIYSGANVLQKKNESK